MDTKQEAYYYGLTWSHTFKHSGDTCYFAHCFPYTYSDLQNYLHKILSDKQKSLFCKHRVLCRTIAGNPVPLLTITSPSLTPHDNKAKRGVVLTARVHPGESNGSWMMKGLLDFLTGSSDDAKILRDLFVFKIVPMLNPDGVIVGNYRCSLSGRDLNRNYRSKLRDSYPTVWHTKAMVKRLCEEREVVLFCDLHGHSRKHNIFIYGCDPPTSDPSRRLRSRVFPRMLSKNSPDRFSYKSSRFAVQKSKEGTGRVVMWREVGIQNSYTLEATFAGSTQGKLKRYQFGTAELEGMGYHLCDTLLDYCDPDQGKMNQIMLMLEDEYRQSVLSTLTSLGQELPPGVDPLNVIFDPSVLGGEESSEGGSNSSESDGPPVHLQWRERKSKKKKKLQSRKERNKKKVVLKMTHHRSSSLPPNLSLTPHEAQQTRKEEEEEEGEEERETEEKKDISSIHHSTSDVSHNGGIPIFVQERMEERLRKRARGGGGGDNEELREKNSNLEGAYIGIPSEELRQALLWLQAKYADSSTHFLPHPACPMNISQVYIHESSRRQSRLTSKTSLPQLSNDIHATAPLLPPPPPLPLPLPLPPPSSSSSSLRQGTFTSHYVANHLQHMLSGSQNEMAQSSVKTAQNSTKNLSNLSRLFRHLRSPVNPLAKPDTAHHNNNNHTPTDTHTCLEERRGGGREGGVEGNFHAGSSRKDERTASRVAVNSSRKRDIEKMVREKEGRKTKDELLELFDGINPRRDNSTTDHMRNHMTALMTDHASNITTDYAADCVSNPMSDHMTGRVTEHMIPREVQTLTSVRNSHHNLNNVQEKRRETPPTGSRGHFTRTKSTGGKRGGKKGKEEEREEEEEEEEEERGGGGGGGVNGKIRRRQRREGDVRTRKDMDTEDVRWTPFGKVTPAETNISTSLLPSHPHATIFPHQTTIKNHKHGIAEAVESVQSKRMLSKQHLHTSHNHTSQLHPSHSPHSKDAPTSRTSAFPSVRPLSPSTEHPSPFTPHASQMEDRENENSFFRHETVNVRRGERGVRKDSGEEMATCRDGRGDRRYLDAYSSQNKPDPETGMTSIQESTSEERESSLQRTYASKPPSRYGPRPRAEDGVMASTVSLMLSGRVRAASRPSTMHSSKRRGRPAHIRYSTKNSKNSSYYVHM